MGVKDTSERGMCSLDPQSRPCGELRVRRAPGSSCAGTADGRDSVAGSCPELAACRAATMWVILENLNQTGRPIWTMTWPHLSDQKNHPPPMGHLEVSLPIGDKGHICGP